MKSVVRRAAIADIDWIVTELQEFSDDIPTLFRLFGSREETASMVKALIEDHVFLVCEKGSELQGFIGGSLGPHPFNSKIKTLSEVVFWVSEKFRGSSAAGKLLSAWVEIGKGMADWVLFAIGRDTRMSERHLLRRGFKPLENYYLLEVG